VLAGPGRNIVDAFFLLRGERDSADTEDVPEADGGGSGLASCTIGVGRLVDIAASGQTPPSTGAIGATSTDVTSMTAPDWSEVVFVKADDEVCGSCSKELVSKPCVVTIGDVAFGLTESTSDVAGIECCMGLGEGRVTATGLGDGFVGGIGISLLRVGSTRGIT
jgi:hypothetical protein